MVAPEAGRALRGLVRVAQRSPTLRQQQRTICAACLANTGGVEPRRAMGRPITKYRGNAVTIHRGTRRRSAHTQTSKKQVEEPETGPIVEYDARVASGRLREDEHQRTIILALQDLHDTLAAYTPPKVVHPTVESLQPPKQTFFGSLLGRGNEKSRVKIQPMPGLPKGLYMYGDVGSGKTMLMDLFFDTLPANITHKTRIHFHNFMQDVHKELHKMKTAHGSDLDAIPFVAATIASSASVLCFDEFQCTDVADAMILRRLIEALMHHGTVLVTTSNRHPSELYKNGIQRDSFLPCIALLESRLRVLNLDSTTDYRKVPRPPSGVYHHPLDSAAQRHADHWFRFLGDFDSDPPHPTSRQVWGREIAVPSASGRACSFAFSDLIGRATGAADYLELARAFDAFVVTGVPKMDLNSREWARRFITFVDACYEARAKLVLTSAVPLDEIFEGVVRMKAHPEAVEGKQGKEDRKAKRKLEEMQQQDEEGKGVSDAMRSLMDDLGMDMEALKRSAMFTGDEESFAFARALSRLVEMGSQEWVERGMGLESKGGKKDADDWKKVKSNWQQDSYY